MAIPWLIGAAAVATVAYLASDDSEEEERRERAERRARARERELEQEAERKRQQAAEDEQRRVVAQKKRQHEQYASDQLDVLILKHKLNSSLNSDNSLSDASIYNTEHCKAALIDAFNRSEATQAVTTELENCKGSIEQLESFYTQLSS
ncbi:MAG: hypothetical protein ACR2M7_04315 [Bdellovibrionales bacterium]